MNRCGGGQVEGHCSKKNSLLMKIAHGLPKLEKRRQYNQVIALNLFVSAP